MDSRATAVRSHPRESERDAANDFRAWVEAEGLLEPKSETMPARTDHRVRGQAETST
jgi:hypothetical protein